MTIVVSDIDGTLVPHPYSSGMSVQQRAGYIQRFGALCSRPFFGVVTGRKKAGFDRLRQEGQLSAQLFPAFLALEFGGQIFFEGNQVHAHEPNALLQKYVLELCGALRTHAEFSVLENIESQIQQGRMRGYVIEQKAAIVQLDWYFSDDAVRSAFTEFLFRFVNPYLLKTNQVYGQVFGHRFDLCEVGFVPKHGVWQKAPAAWKKNITSNGLVKPELIVLGDELYDAYMFQSFKALVPSVFSKVEACAVGGPLPFADRVFANEADALDYVEAVLK